MEKIKMNLKEIYKSVIKFPEMEGVPFCEHIYEFTYYENEYGDEITTFKIDDEIVFTVRHMSPSMLLSRPSSFILDELGMDFLTTTNLEFICNNEYNDDDTYKEVELSNILPTEIVLSEFTMLSSDIKLKGQHPGEEDIPIKNIKSTRYLSSSGLYIVVDLIVDEDGNTEESAIYNSFYDVSKCIVSDVFTLYRYNNWLKKVKEKYRRDNSVFLSYLRNVITNVISPNSKYIDEDGKFIYKPESDYDIPYVIHNDSIIDVTDDQLCSRIDTIVFCKALGTFDRKREGIYNYSPCDSIKVYKPIKPEGSSEFYGMTYYSSEINRFMIIDYTGKYVYLTTNPDLSFSEEQMRDYNIYQIDGRYYVKCGLVPNAINTTYEYSFIKSIISYFDELDLSNIHDSHITFIDEYTTALKNVKIIIK